VCGFGETGLLLGRALDRLGRRFVAVEIDPLRAQEVRLLDLAQDAPTLAADARHPEHLLAAGLVKPECRGVLALTNDDQANLAVAMSVRLLNPAVPVIARAMTREVAANMASFGTDRIVNPFSTFGGYLALAIDSPGSYRLLSWLTGLPGTTLGPETAPPRGHWIVCGYGRFGREVVEAFRREAMDVTVIDPSGCDVPGLGSVRGLGTEAGPLREAGVERAVGLVAGTDDDVTNLSIAVTARELNPALFTILRQNLQANRALFDAYRAGITMVSSEIVAHECLAVLKTPRLARFLDLVREKDDAWADAVVERLHAALGPETPELWGVPLTPAGAPAIHLAIAGQGRDVPLGALGQDPAQREQMLPCVPLAIARGDALLLLPADGEALKAGDEILYAGTPEARDAQWPVLRNLNERDYVLDGVDRPGGWVWKWWAARRMRP
jgi:voltage-gated potassium channel Kch